MCEGIILNEWTGAQAVSLCTSMRWKGEHRIRNTLLRHENGVLLEIECLRHGPVGAMATTNRTMLSETNL